MRGLPLVMDSDLASIYHVSTKVFNQAVKRNLKRFPEAFAFQLTDNDWDILKSQFVTSSQHEGAA